MRIPCLLTEIHYNRYIKFRQMSMPYIKARKKAVFQLIVVNKEKT